MALARVAIKICVLKLWREDVCSMVFGIVGVVIDMVCIPSQHKSIVTIFFLPVGDF